MGQMDEEDIDGDLEEIIGVDEDLEIVEVGVNEDLEEIIEVGPEEFIEEAVGDEGLLVDL